MKTISLLKDWHLLEMPLETTKSDFETVLGTGDGWMDIKTLPCDVHMPLVEYGKIDDPNVAMASFDCEWVEQRSWWFKKEFEVCEGDITRFGSELFIEMLDIHADIFLNGDYIGHHASAMYPFKKDVTPWLKVGKNTLLIRLTTGIETVCDSDVAQVRDYVACEFRSRREGRGDDRRTMLRKPQYVFGWDQSPRLATCAIAGDVRVDFLDEIVVRDIHFETLAIEKACARIFAEATIDNREALFARECEATFELALDGKVVHTETKKYLSQCGLNYIDFSFTLDNPQLWWPNGYGEQPLYTVTVTAVNMNGARHQKEITTGVRTVALDMTQIGDDERLYAFCVNGKRIYCRGTDFIQSEHLYAKITDELQNKLISAARDAHFCMLRFWDGNVYQSDYVYSLCDRLGILVIQNFCFACAAYPDHLEEFRKEVQNEAEYQLIRLRNHPCLAMWYGNGENTSILDSYLGKNYFKEFPQAIYTGGTYVYNTLLPKLHHALNKTVPYQCTTPFGNFSGSESEKRGDRHYYPFLNISPENQQYRISAQSIDDLECKFITEGGIMGPPSKSALMSYCGGDIDFDSDVFLHHRNTFEKDAVRDAIYRHYTGKRELTLDEYCLYGGIFQGSLLGYEAEHIRTRKNCYGSLLWCFNDGFGEVGFSVMDHYGNPKPVYYYLKRAYAPQRIIIKKEGENAVIYVTNSAPTPFECVLEYGYQSFEGKKDSQTVKVSLDAFAGATAVVTLKLNSLDLKSGVVFGAVDGLDSATLRAHDFKELNVNKKATLTVKNLTHKDGNTTFEITADCFAHAVHLDIDESVRLSDNYFDLLAGQTKTVTVYGKTLERVTADSIFIK